MSRSYFGLFAAFVSEIVTRKFARTYDDDDFWTRFGVFLVIFPSIFGWLTMHLVNK